MRIGYKVDYDIADIHGTVRHNSQYFLVRGYGGDLDNVAECRGLANWMVEELKKDRCLQPVVVTPVYEDEPSRSC